jgi:hypothetical protein
MQNKPLRQQLSNFGSSKRANDKKNVDIIELEGNNIELMEQSPASPRTNDQTRSKPSGVESSIASADLYDDYEAADLDSEPMRTFHDIPVDSDFYNSEDSVNNPIH